MDDRKKRIMEHVARSSGDFIKRSTVSSNGDRKRQIMEHVQRSKG